MRELRVELGGGYPILIGDGLRKGAALIKHVGAHSKRVVVISDDNVAPLYAHDLEAHLKAHGLETILITMPAGDEHKTRDTKNRIEDQMMQQGFGRDTVIVALGGGVVCDMAGFVASTYMRGVPVVYVPTTLLAMVDASVGGKTGVNTDYGKNLIGTITHPKAVLMDIATLKTQQDNEFVGGFIELVKHALLRGKAEFADLVTHLDRILARDFDLLERLVAESCAIKRDVVEIDELEKGLRQTLNLGHTLAHAIETASAYRIAHGPAVALGLLGEAAIAVELGHMTRECFERINDFIRPLLAHMHHSLEGLDRRSIVNLMTLDKKARGKVPHFVLLEAIGKVVVQDGKHAITVPSEAIEHAVDYVLAEFGTPC